MDNLHPLTKIKDSLAPIRNETVMPILKLQETIYLVDISLSGRDTLIWTEFTPAGVPIVSKQAKYATYHTYLQVLRNVMPGTTYEELQHHILPEPPVVLTVPQILAGYKD